MDSIFGYDFSSLNLGHPLVTTTLSYLLKATAVLAIMSLAWFISRRFARLIDSRLSDQRVDQTLVRFASSSVRWVVMGLSLLLCMNVFGLNITSFAALLGAAGVTIGLAFQGSLSNLAAGIMLLFVRPFDVGDLVEVSGQFGRVDRITLIMTRLVTLDNKYVVIPNRKVLDDNIENHTRFGARRIEVEVGVAYGTDLEHAQSVILDAAREISLDDCPEPNVLLTGFGGSSIDFSVMVWGPSHEWRQTIHRAILAVNNALVNAEIEIPFPQLDLRTPEGLVMRQRSSKSLSAAV